MLQLAAAINGVYNKATSVRRRIPIYSLLVLKGCESNDREISDCLEQCSQGCSQPRQQLHSTLCFRRPEPIGYLSLSNNLVLSLSSSCRVSPFPSGASSLDFLSLAFLNSNVMPMANRHPCKMPVTRYIPHVLQPSHPNLAARLPTQTKLPGVCIHIIGILKLSTACSFHVVYIWGRNWMAARQVPMIPRTLAHSARWEGTR